MLQQPSVQPALGAADALDATGVHEVGHGGACKTVGPSAAGRFISEVKIVTQGLKTIDQPLTSVSIGLATSSGGLRPDQGVRETAGMQHSTATAGPAHQRETTR